MWSVTVLILLLAMIQNSELFLTSDILELSMSFAIALNITTLVFVTATPDSENDVIISSLLKQNENQTMISLINIGFLNNSLTYEDENTLFVSKSVDYFPISALNSNTFSFLFMTLPSNEVANSLRMDSQVFYLSNENVGLGEMPIYEAYSLFGKKIVYQKIGYYSKFAKKTSIVGSLASRRWELLKDTQWRTYSHFFQNLFIFLSYRHMKIMLIFIKADHTHR